MMHALKAFLEKRIAERAPFKTREYRGVVQTDDYIELLWMVKKALEGK